MTDTPREVELERARLEKQRTAAERGLRAQYDARTLRLGATREFLGRISREDEDRMADRARAENGAAAVAAVREADRRHAELLAGAVKAVDDALAVIDRESGDRRARTQARHARRALVTAVKVLLSPSQTETEAGNTP